ncbi:MAG: PHP domain-containing protein [Clostridia bacterium]|nr:PHP domain-containing protein [Clostridia bacterium]
MSEFRTLDLHMHTTVSDGTDTPEQLLACVKNAGLDLFSVTDHDSIKGCEHILANLASGDPAFVTGVEFSCRDELGKYHILGYGYDPESAPVREVAEAGHRFRIRKTGARLDYLEKEFGIKFSEEDLAALFSQDNPGKPHIGILLVRYGYAQTISEAFSVYLDRIHFRSEYVRPETAISGILQSGGIPVLAHPAYGSGRERIVGDELALRVRRLMGFGLQGLEAYYGGIPEDLLGQTISLSERFGLYATAGSDYHGRNKTVRLGETGLPERKQWSDGLRRFLKEVPIRSKEASETIVNGNCSERNGDTN